MNDKLMPIAKAVMQAIDIFQSAVNRFFWATYCGLRQFACLMLIFIIYPEWIFPLIGTSFMYSLPYAVFFHWVAAFSKETSIFKKYVISYIPHMIVMLVLIYFGESVRDSYLSNMLPFRLSKTFSFLARVLLASFAPIFPIALTKLEIFVKKRLHGRWYELVKFAYNAMALLSISGLQICFFWLLRRLYIAM